MGRPQLTISLLASNRPDTIRRCLDSLRPIMETIPSELILVDTSKSPVVHEILSEYTDQIYEFEWCKDFSKARNVGLKNAKGEWFLFLDDDEWFVEIDELIRFFQSGEYKNYGYANYQVRNFYDPSFTYYSDSWVSRMIRIDADTEFRSKIHEYMYPVRGKCKHIYSLAYHSGYIFATEEQKRAHFERNSSLLLEMMKEEPENLRWQMQLVQEYRSVKEWDTLCNFCEERIDATKHVNDKYDNVHLGTFYAGHSEGLVFKKEYKLALAVCEEAIKDGRSTELCKALMHLRMGECCLKLEDYQNAKKYIELYFEELNSLGKNESVLTVQKMALLVNEAFDETNIKKAYSILISCDLKQGSTGLLNKYYEELGWNSEVIYVFDGTQEYLVEAMATMPCEPIFVQMVADAYKNREFRKLMCKEANRWEEIDEEGFKRILSVYAQADVDDAYIWYARCRMAYYEKDVEAFCNAVENIFRTVHNVFDIPKSLYQILENENIDIAECLNSLSVDLWKHSIRNMVMQEDEAVIEDGKSRLAKVLDEQDWRYGYYEAVVAEKDNHTEAVLEFYQLYYKEECLTENREHLPEGVQKMLGVEIPEWMKEIDDLGDKGIVALEQARSSYEAKEDIQGIYFRKTYASELIKLESQQEDYETLYKRFETFAEYILDYYVLVFSERAFEGEMEMLPPEARAAVYINAMLGCAQNDWESKIAYLRESAKSYAALGNNIKKLARFMGEKQKSENSNTANAELMQMVGLMKERIRMMAQQGLKEEALAVLIQVRTLVPADRELIRMEEEIKGIHRDVVLSISILASNRKETIEKTLQSLEELRKKVSCELIIVDTGCSEELHNYLASYADVITKFEWCNDFAKARNVGLELATGEWFMYMDDDEWFTDVEELVEFFTSGKYKGYDAASYVVRNYLDMQGTQYTDSWVSRMVRLEPGMQFKSRIHEYLTPAGERRANIHAVADHYGYVYETEEALRKHFERNESLLKEMIAEEPNTLRWYMLLAQEYRTVCEWPSLFELGEKTLALVVDSTDVNTYVALGTFYGAQIVAKKEQGENEDVLLLCKKALTDTRNTELFRAFCELQMSWAAYWLGQYEEAMTHSVKYLEWLDFFADKEEMLITQRTAPFVADCFDIVMQKQVYSILICAELRLGSKLNLEKYLSKLEWNSKYIYLFEDMIPTLIEAIHNMGEEAFTEVLQEMQKSKALWKYFCESRAQKDL